MILYNVTVKVDETIQDDWLNYMLEKHIQDVVDTGCFVHCRISELLGQQANEGGKTYSIQYSSPSMKDFHRYQAQFAPALQKDHVEKFGDKALAYRTMMEVVKEVTPK